MEKRTIVTDLIEFLNSSQSNRFTMTHISLARNNWVCACTEKLFYPRTNMLKMEADINYTKSIGLRDIIEYPIRKNFQEKFYMLLNGNKKKNILYKILGFNVKNVHSLFLQSYNELNVYYGSNDNLPTDNMLREFSKKMMCCEGIYNGIGDYFEFHYFSKCYWWIVALIMFFNDYSNYGQYNYLLRIIKNRFSISPYVIDRKKYEKIPLNEFINSVYNHDISIIPKLKY